MRKNKLSPWSFEGAQQAQERDWKRLPWRLKISWLEEAQLFTERYGVKRAAGNPLAEPYRDAVRKDPSLIRYFGAP